MRSAAAELGHHTGDALQHRGQRRPGDLGDEDLARLDVLEVVLAEDDARLSRAPADAGRLAAQCGVTKPQSIGGWRGLDPQGARLEDLKPGVGERPLDLDRTAEERFGLRRQARELAGASRIETGRVDELACDGVRPWPGVAAPFDPVIAAQLAPAPRSAA